MVTRAGVSEDVFRKVFGTVEKCYRAAFDQGLDSLSRALSEATSHEEAWLERVRSGLVAMLGFFDDEPSWGRLLVFDPPLDSALTYNCKQRLHQVLAGLLEGDGADTYRHSLARAGGSPRLWATLTGELVVGGVFSVIRTSMLEGDECKLVELAPPLMAFIVAPYLGKAAAQAELEGRPCGAGESSAGAPVIGRSRAPSSAGKLPIRATHRTMLVLRAIARAPYSNNREIARAAGLADEGQTSKLLARLEGRGVIDNVGVGAARGEPNAWLLTASGRRVIELVDADVPSAARRSRDAGTTGRGARGAGTRGVA